MCEMSGFYCRHRVVRSVVNAEKDTESDRHADKCRNDESKRGACDAVYITKMIIWIQRS